MDPDEVLDIKGYEGVARCAREEFGAVGVTDWTAKQAVNRREIVPTRLGSANWFCRRDVREWLQSRRQTSVYRAGEGVKAR